MSEMSLCTCDRMVSLLLLHLQVNSVTPLVHIHFLISSYSDLCHTYDRCIGTSAHLYIAVYCVCCIQVTMSDTAEGFSISK